MKRAGGGFDNAYNAQTAVDETAHIIVAAELVNTNSDVQQLPMVLAAVKTHTGSVANQVLADAGYRSEAVMAELARTQPDTELVIALGREGKALVKPRQRAPEKRKSDALGRGSVSITPPPAPALRDAFTKTQSISDHLHRKSGSPKSFWRPDS